VTAGVTLEEEGHINPEEFEGIVRHQMELYTQVLVPHPCTRNRRLAHTVTDTQAQTHTVYGWCI
jgi:hypothetical protein